MKRATTWSPSGSKNPGDGAGKALSGEQHEKTKPSTLVSRPQRTAVPEGGNPSSIPNVNSHFAKKNWRTALIASQSTRTKPTKPTTDSGETDVSEPIDMQLRLQIRDSTNKISRSSTVPLMSLPWR